MATRASLLTAKEVADLLRTSRKAIYERLRRDGASIPGVVRVGRRLLFKAEEISRWLGEGGSR